MIQMVSNDNERKRGMGSIEWVNGWSLTFDTIDIWMDQLRFI